MGGLMKPPIPKNPVKKENHAENAKFAFSKAAAAMKANPKLQVPY